MSSYETHIGKVDNSTFAIGQNARAEAKFSRGDRDDMAETLKELLVIVSKYTDPAADEVLHLAQAATYEISADKPKKEVFRRLADATRKMMNKLGPGITQAGALADAVAKISDMIRHL
jgi:uncharacterized protein YqeY